VPLLSRRRSPRRHASSRRYDVVFYIPTISPLLAPTREAPPGGAETQVFLLSQALAARGIRVALIAYELPDGVPRTYANIDIIPRPPDVGRKRLVGKVIEAVRIWQSLATVEAPVIVRRMAGADTAIIGAFARLRRRRFIYSSANVVDFDPTELLSKRRDRALYRIGIRLAHRVVVQTEEQIPLCERTFKRKPALIKSIAEPATDGIQSEPSAFIWIGRVCSYKRPLEFVELARAVPEARFWMVAVPPPERAEESDASLWRRLQAASTETKNLELLEPRPRNELRLLIRCAIAVVNTADYEGMPNIFLEGWREGVPALALNHDPGGVISTHGLGAFATGSRARFAEVARMMWRERGHRAAVAERCLGYVRRVHSPEKIAAQWATLLAIEGGTSFTSVMTSAASERSCAA
jgi:glycosyltransferase involved in cell wall biosynthesis